MEMSATTIHGNTTLSISQAARLPVEGPPNP